MLRGGAEVISEFAVQSGHKDESVSADEQLTIAQRNHSIAEGEIAEIRGCAV